jgi:S-DNA-T family DNA segregation ATPase FtsK/SpoIIIE
VKTWRSIDGFLGDGSFQAGIRATELRPGKDRGTSLVTGITEERFELLKWYYLEADDDTGYDAATEVEERAMKKAKVTKRPEAAGEARDLLQDAHEAMGEDGEIRASHLADRLREMDLAYRSMDGVKLTKLLAAQGVEVKKKDGFPTVRAQRVLRALDAREGVPWDD